MGLIDKALRWLGLRAEIPAAQRNEILTALAEPDPDRIKGYELYARYYDGNHKVKLTDRTKAYLENSGLEWSENFCETVVDTLSDRLHVTGFACRDNEAAREWLDDFWDGDAIAEVQGTVHNQTPLLGDGFVGVGWDAEAGLPTLHWNDPSCCTPIYNAAGELLMLAKVWNEAAVTPTNPNGEVIRRLNLYYPDRIEKWFTFATPGSGQNTTWAMHIDVEGERWPIDWTRPGGIPRGVAVVPFRNKPKGRNFGRSELRSTIPQQDYLNKQLIDLSLIMDNQAWDQRWGTGISPETAANLRNVPGELWASPNEQARFGQFPAADPRGLLVAIEGTMQRIAARSQRPLHLLFNNGNLPSGESLKTAESPLIHTGVDRQRTYGLSWSTIAALLAGLEADYGRSGLSYAGEAFQAQWRDLQSRNEITELDVAQRKEAVGVSQKTVLEELGYDAEEEAAYRRDESLERAKAFSAGIGGDPEDPGATLPPVAV